MLISPEQKYLKPLTAILLQQQKHHNGLIIQDHKKLLPFEKRTTIKLLQAMLFNHLIGHLPVKSHEIPRTYQLVVPCANIDISVYPVMTMEIPMLFNLNDVQLALLLMKKTYGDLLT